MKNLLAITIILIGLNAVKAQRTGTLKVKVTNLESTEGVVKVGVYDSETNYMINTCFSKEVIIESKESVEVSFDNVPFGKYAISVYHDSNGNNELDSNFLGIPSEDYAFSNNADGRFGPPDYEKCVFELNSHEVIQTIKIN